jgi:hypothetical protein
MMITPVVCVPRQLRGTMLLDGYLELCAPAAEPSTAAAPGQAGGPTAALTVELPAAPREQPWLALLGGGAAAR